MGNKPDNAYCDQSPTKGSTVIYGSILVTVLVILAIIYLAKRV